MSYRPRIADPLLDLRINAGIDALAEEPRFAAATEDLVEAFVTGSGEFAADEFAPLNRPGGTEGAVAERGSVRAAAGLRRRLLCLR